MRRLMQDRSGSTLVEFAVSLPVLIGLYVSIFTLSDQMAASRKVTATTRTITDLVTRSVSISTSGLDTVLAASAQVLAPYDLADASVRVSQLQVTGATSARVVWSQARNGTALTVGDTVTLPSGVAATNAYLIMGEVNYTYHPALNTAALGLGSSADMTLYDRTFMSPRNSAAVGLTTS
jgi:Flp pilus assembly protein TadG